MEGGYSRSAGDEPASDAAKVDGPHLQMLDAENAEEVLVELVLGPRHPQQSCLALKRQTALSPVPFAWPAAVLWHLQLACQQKKRIVAVVASIAATESRLSACTRSVLCA